MSKLIPVLILFIIFSLPGIAQNRSTDANIVGHVTYKGEHLSYINIVAEGTTIGTTTDLTGHYLLINLVPGTYTIVARGVGYTSERKEVTVISGQTEEINFELQEDVFNLEEVVVTADRNETSRAESPVIVNTIDSKLFKSAQAITIAEGLDFVPGLRTERNCQNCGFSQVRMNGMDGHYSQILINSRPVFSGLAGIYGLDMFPANMVDRVEVVRGGGSAMFGGNAIAGTVNIITRAPNLNTFSIDVRAGVIGVGNNAGTEPSNDNLLTVKSGTTSIPVTRMPLIP